MPRVSKGTRTNAKHKPQTIPPKFQAGFLAAMDGRTELARALKDNRDSIISDLGGPEEIGHVKAALVERFVWLEAVLQTLEHEMATGQVETSEALGKWIQAVNSLSGLAKALGVERKPMSAQAWLGPAQVNGHSDNGDDNG